MPVMGRASAPSFWGSRTRGRARRLLGSGSVGHDEDLCCLYLLCGSWRNRYGALDESMKERQQRIKSEERALNRERARRLHDLHQQSRISSESLAAMQREKAMEGRCSSAEDDAQSVARTCGLLETGMIANQHITSEGTHTQMRQERAIEWSHAERVMLKSALQESRGYSLKMRLENQFLRAEL